MYIYNLCFSKILLEYSIFSVKSYLAFSLIIYLFALTQESNFDKRDTKVGMSLDQKNLLKVTEHLFYVHFALMAIVYSNNWLNKTLGLIDYNTASFCISNILIIFFFLAILNISSYYSLGISNMRAQIIKYSYYLILAFMACSNIILLFILLEIYSVLFFLYLIGFNHSLQEILYYLQHDLTVYIFFGLISTLFYILGIFFIILDYGLASLKFEALKIILESNYIYNSTIEHNLISLRGIFFILISIFIKIGLAPFQGWTVRFFKRTCFQSLVFMLLISKLILIYGAFFTFLPIIVNITPVLKFIGLFGFISYILGSYLLFLRHAESDKLLAYINLTSSGFFFSIFFINNPQNYNFAFIYFSSFMVLMNFTLLVFFSPTVNWVSKLSYMIQSKEVYRDYQKNFNIIQGSAFSDFDKIWVFGYMHLNKHELCKLLLHAVLASLPPTVTFYAKLLYDFSFFNSLADLSTPYGFIVIIGMLTYILTVYGFLSLWRQLYIRGGRNATTYLVRHTMIVLAEGHNLLSFVRIFKRYSLTIFFLGGFGFSNFNII